MEINKTYPCNSANHGGTRYTKNIKYIVIHYTANKTDKAVNNAKYFNQKVVKASAHYFVDEISIYQSVEENVIAWAVGGSKYDNCDSTGGGTMYKKITNNNSVSIEMCSTAGKIAKQTQNNTVELIKSIMSRYNIPISNIYRHFDVTGKPCPGWSGWIGSNDTLWQAFKKEITAEKLYESVNEIVNALTTRAIVTDTALWSKKMVGKTNAYWLGYKIANKTKNSLESKNRLETINDIVWELHNRKIITDDTAWMDILASDKDLYWLAYKAANLTVNK